MIALSLLLPKNKKSIACAGSQDMVSLSEGHTLPLVPAAMGWQMQLVYYVVAAKIGFILNVWLWQRMMLVGTTVQMPIIVCPVLTMVSLMK